MYTTNQLLVLEQSVNYLQDALYSGNREKVLYNLSTLKSNYPDIASEADELVRRMLNYQGVFDVVRMPVYSLSDDGLINNARAFIAAASVELRELYPHPFSFYAAERIYYPTQTFSKQEVLYERTDGEKLTVSDLLSVTSYATKFIDALSPNEVTGSAGEALTVFKGMELALNNKKTDRPNNKSLHLANDFLLNTIKPNLSKSGKQTASGISLLIDLAIDFFVKG